MQHGTIQPATLRKVYFDYSSTQIYIGSLLQYKTGAGPQTNFIQGPGFDVTVLAAVTGVAKALIAGVVVDLGQGAGVADGWVTIALLVPSQVYTFAVAVAVDTGDGLRAVATQGYMDDSSTYAVTDVALCLYDEDSSENPHGADAISASIGLVEAIWTLYDLQGDA
ncbi:MAG TPA: hypothetical protein ENH62_07075 [Marinobacter sp.]|nr:hypothetical protein [Marinobacter sp.]